MARRRKATPSSSEARFEASRIQAARRRGYTNREIADAFGINERTVRKIISGETSGKRIYREKIAPTRNVGPEAQNLSIVRLDLVIGKDAQGHDVVRSVNAKTPLIGGRTPTPFDVLIMPDLAAVADAEALRLKRQYAGGRIKETFGSENDRCERRGCGHVRGDHDEESETEDFETGECHEPPEGHCPAFVEPSTRIASIRPIVRRDASKRLVTITRTFGAAL